MELLQHTTYDAVRATLGVSARELKDDVISLPHWTIEVEQELRDIDGGAGAVLSRFATVYAVAEGTRTSDQTQFLKVLDMYVLYSVSLQLLQRADVFSPQNITDGKAAVQRLADRFDRLRPAIQGSLQKLKERVKAALQVLDPAAAVATVTSRRMFLTTGLGTDPVTGA